MSYFIVLTTEQSPAQLKAAYIVNAESAREAKRIVQQFYGGDRVDMLAGMMDTNSSNLTKLEAGEMETWCSDSTGSSEDDDETDD